MAEKLRIESISGGRTFWNLIGEKIGIASKASQAQVTAIAVQVAGLVSGKADKVQPAWVNLTMLNTATSGEDVNTYAPAYMKDTLGFVHLRGRIADTVQGTTIAATLPPGFRPSKRLYFRYSTGGITVSITILTNGELHVAYSVVSGDNTYAYVLENCPPFFAEG